MGARARELQMSREKILGHFRGAVPEALQEAEGEQRRPQLLGILAAALHYLQLDSPEVEAVGQFSGVVGADDRTLPAAMQARFVADKFGGGCIPLGLLSPPHAVWIAQYALSLCEISQR